MGIYTCLPVQHCFYPCLPIVATRQSYHYTISTKSLRDLLDQHHALRLAAKKETVIRRGRIKKSLDKMKCSGISSALTLISVFASTSTMAFPLSFLQKRSPQTYSVVPVDGGNSGTAATKTITDNVTQTAYTTILATILSTQSGGAVSTIVSTVTSAVTITSAGPTVVVTATPSTATVSAPAQTVTVAPSMTSSAYDNGQWHTTYYSSWTVTPSSSLTSFSTISASSAATSSAVTASTQASSTSSEPATATNWADYYGTALATPKDGSWWGSRT